MATYRIYQMTHDGHVAGPATAFELQTDEEALAAARRIVGRFDIEIWQGARVVGRLEKSSARPRETSTLPRHPEANHRLNTARALRLAR